MTYALPIFFIALMAKLWVDIRLWKRGKGNDHVLGPALIVALIGFCTILAGWESLPLWLFAWWALFDTLWGLIVLGKPFYVGTTARLDILQRKYPWIQVAKYVGLILSIILYVTI